MLDDKIQKDNLKEDKKYEKNWWGNKVIDLNSNISIVTFRVNGLKVSIKRQTFSHMIKIHA